MRKSDSNDPKHSEWTPTLTRIADSPALRAYRTPETIGPFRIVRKLGEGGMGVVYEAMQELPQRRIALKIVRSGHFSEHTAKRFELEVKVLGSLSHPNIAQIHEAGTFETESGTSPYFAMEFVDGCTIDEYISANAISQNDTLILIMKIARAVNYAHLNGVIHRDLKPANILVTHNATAKIVDFGVAKAVDEDLKATETLTNPGDIVGTLAYMSPEQVQGGSVIVDFRSDVYSLGVVAFQLLTGRPPFDLHGKGLSESLKIIQFATPPRAGQLRTSLRGDIEVIIAKCMMKEPEARYRSADEFAVDLERYLSDQPIQARPASALYRLRKFTKRHLPAVTSAALVFLVLVSATFLVSQQAWRTGLAEQQAKRDRDIAREQAYAANVSAASFARERERFSLMRSYLDRAPLEHRGWEWHFLDQWLRGSCAQIEIGSPIWCLAFDPSGRWLATGSGDCLVRIWDTDDWSLRRTFHSESCVQNPWELVWSNDSRHIAVAHVERTHDSYNGSISIHDLEDEQVELSIEIPGKEWPHSLLFSPDSSSIYAGCSDRTVREWDAKTGEPIRVFGESKIQEWSRRGHKDWYVRALQLSPDHQFLLAESSHGPLRIWRIDTGEELDPAQHAAMGLFWYGPNAMAAQFDPTGKYILTATNTLDGAVWNAETREVEHVITLPITKHIDVKWWKSVRFSADGSRVFTNGRVLTSFDTENGDVVWNSPLGGASRMRMDVDPSGKWVVAANVVGTLSLVGQSTRSFSWSRPSENIVSQISFSPDGTLLAAQYFKAPGFAVWNLDQQQVQWDFSERVTRISFSQDGHYIFASQNNGSMHQFDSSSGDIVHTFRDSQYSELKSDGYTLGVLRTSPDDERVFATVSGTQLVAWKTDTGEEAVRILLHDQKYVDDDGRFGFLIDFDRNALWTIHTNGFAVKWNHDGTECRSTSLLVDNPQPGGTVLVGDVVPLEDPTSVGIVYSHKLDNHFTGSAFVVWDLERDEKLSSLRFVNHIPALDATTDGKRIVRTSNGINNSSISIHSARDGAELIVFDTDWMHDVKFSPDGRRVAAAGAGIRVWELPEIECNRLDNEESDRHTAHLSRLTERQSP